MSLILNAVQPQTSRHSEWCIVAVTSNCCSALSCRWKHCSQTWLSLPISCWLAMWPGLLSKCQDVVSDGSNCIMLSLPAEREVNNIFRIKRVLIQVGRPDTGATWPMVLKVPEGTCRSFHQRFLVPVWAVTSEKPKGIDSRNQSCWTNT